MLVSNFFVNLCPSLLLHNHNQLFFLKNANLFETYLVFLNQLPDFISPSFWDSVSFTFTFSWTYQFIIISSFSSFYLLVFSYSHILIFSFFHLFIFPSSHLLSSLIRSLFHSRLNSSYHRWTFPTQRPGYLDTMTTVRIYWLIVFSVLFPSL